MSKVHSIVSKDKQRSLSFTDGFNFGCGFWAAWLVFFIIIIPATIITIMILLSLGLLVI